MNCSRCGKELPPNAMYCPNCGFLAPPLQPPHKTKLSQEQLLSKAIPYLQSAGYKVKTKGYVLEAVNGRDYNDWIAILLFLLALPIFFVYWFTRKKNRMTVDASVPEIFTVIYEGRDGAADAKILTNMFKAQ